MDTYDIIVIGSGAAGYTAALYASRAFLKTLVVAGTEIGGQLTTTTLVENFPGFANGILGPELMEIMATQVKRFGTVIVNEAVKKIDTTKRPFTVTTESGSYSGKSVIIATGASARYLGLPSEERLKGKGVSGCATCDGFFFKDKDVAVIGGGDTAMEEATFLTRFASKVIIVHRRDEFRASAVMLKRARENPKISFLINKQVTEVLGETAVTGIRLKDTKTGEESDLPVQGMFLAIGHTPNTGFLDGVINRDAKGYIDINMPKNRREPHTETNVDGIFAAGDCVDPRYRQAVVAAGMGCMAALDAQHWLESQ